MYGLGLMYAQGRGVTQNEAEGARWMFAALEKSDPFATKEMTTNALEWTIRFRAELQKRLRDAGVYSGRAEGDVGPDFSEAIAALAASAKH
jgi:TPR repeat protein